MDLRPWTPADTDALVALWRDSFLATGLPGAEEAELDHLKDKLKRGVAEGWSVYVAFRGEALAGFLALGRAAGKLEQIFVAPAHQREGLGRKMMAFAKAEMPKGFVLRMAAANLPARRLYESAGMRIVSTERHPRHGHDIMTYEWRPHG